MEDTSQDLVAGKLLISEPFLFDPNFKRSVVLLTEHEDQGDVGFILNKPLEDVTISTVLDIQTPQEVPLYMGGPVQQDTLHFIHREPELLPDSREVMPGLYWGGNFERVRLLLERGELPLETVRFFVGYSGWGRQQLAQELHDKSWIVTSTSIDDIFNPDVDRLWREVLIRLGGKFRIYANSPENPQYN